jgi:hypothetical protein
MERGRLTFNLQVNMGLWAYLDVTWSIFPFGNVCAFVNKQADKVNGDKQEKQNWVSKKIANFATCYFKR